MKPSWQSKTLWVNFIVAALALFWPEANEFVTENPEAMVVGMAFINLILRLLTRGQVTLLLLPLLMASCSTTNMELQTDVIWKKDLPYCIKDVGCFEGVSVVPDRPDYSIELEPKGDADIDLVIFNTCHREEAFEKTSTGWFIFKQKNRFRYYFKPTPRLETRPDCDLKANTLEEDEGRHAWMIMRREHPFYKLPARIACNGTYSSFPGVSACQAKVGLIQRIEFETPVEFGIPREGCELPHKKDGGYEWKMSKGECIYIIRDQQDRRHSMLTYGYEGIPIRKEDE